MHDIPYSTDRFDTETVRLKLSLKLLEIIRHWQGHEDMSIEGEDHQTVVRFLRDIFDTHAVDLDESGLLDRSHVQSDRFRRKSENFTGLSLKNFITQWKLGHSCEQILQGEKLSVIAKQYHFTDASHYRRVFKQYFQMTPVEYRTSRVAQ